MKKIIAIGGPHGSGKSSVAKRLAKEFNMNYVSAGEVFRSIAKERGLSMEQMSKRVLDEPDLDRQIDERTKKLGLIDNTVVDAQLAAHFTPVNTAIKICITASFDIRAKRIANREGASYELSSQETKVREISERKRFLDLYNIDINDQSLFDVIINNNRIDEETTYQITKAIIKSIIPELN